MEPSRTCDVADSTMKGRNIIDEKRVFRSKTGITALPPSASFLNES